MTTVGTSRTNGFARRGTPPAPSSVTGAAPDPAPDHASHPFSHPASHPVSSEVLALCDAATLLARSVTQPLQRLCLRSGDCVVDLEFAPPAPLVSATPPVSVSAPAPAVPADAGAGTGALSTSDPKTAALEGVMVRAPLVGTFYCASSPGEPPFVEVGDEVTPGQTVGIVEAMKLMNPIVAETAGTVLRILAADATSVEYDQPLIELGPSRAIEAIEAIEPVED